jgi:hypothetical protein
MGVYGLDRCVSEYGQVAGSCECGNEPSSSIKMRGISRLAEDLLASNKSLCTM